MKNTVLCAVQLTCAALVLSVGAASGVSGPASPGGELRIMAGPIAQDVTDHSATVFWLTSREAPMTLKYGLKEGSIDQTGVPEPRIAGRNGNQEHRVRLKNLRPNQTYFFQILSEAGEPQATGQFQTESSEYAQTGRLKIVDGPVLEYLDSGSVEIAWTTDAPSSTLLRYGTDPNGLRKTAQAPWGQETHRVRLTGLEPNTKYYFVVESSQARGSGTMAKSAEGSFRTQYHGEAALTNIEPRR